MSLKLLDQLSKEAFLKPIFPFICLFFTLELFISRVMHNAEILDEGILYDVRERFSKKSNLGKGIYGS